MTTNAYPWILKTLLFGTCGVMLLLLFILPYGTFGKLYSWKYAGNVSTSFFPRFWTLETFLGWEKLGFPAEMFPCNAAQWEGTRNGPNQ